MNEGDPNQENGELAEEDDQKKYPNTTEELREEVRECFDIFDKDKDGQINFQDLGNLLRWLNFNPTEREMKKYTEEYDKNGVNMINYKTVLEIVNQKVLEPDTIEELVEAMKVFDYSGDGTIQLQELRWAMTKLGDGLEETAVDDMIKEIDVEGKGQQVKIIDFAKICFNIKEKKSKD